MEKLQAKGEIPEDELRALEEDVTGKVSMDELGAKGSQFMLLSIRSCSRHGEARDSRLSRCFEK